MALENVYITSATRTAVGKAKRGTLVNVRPDDMAAAVIASACERSGIKPEQVQDVTIGCAIPEQAQGMPLRIEVNAVLKFKYNTRVEDGVAKEVPGVQHIITFKLED